MPVLYEREGTEFQVNTHVLNNQSSASVAQLVGGGYVIVWMSPFQGNGIFAQMYNSSGTPVGAETPVNLTAGAQPHHPTVAGLSNGGYVVTWMSYDQNGSGWEINAQIRDSAGAAVGGEILVNTTAAGDQQSPVVTALAGGGFAITWMSANENDNTGGVYTRAYEATGTALTSETLVHATTVANLSYPSVSAIEGGGYVVTWASEEQDGNTSDIFAQVYDVSGAAVGSEIRISTTTDGNQYDSSVAGLEGGGYVVTWVSFHGGSWDVYSQAYDEAGAAIGGETRVNTTTVDTQNSPSVAGLPGGGYVISWQSYNQDGGGYGIYAQTFDSTATPVGVETLVNTFTASDQRSPSVAGTRGRWLCHHLGVAPAGRQWFRRLCAAICPCQCQHRR